MGLLPLLVRAAVEVAVVVLEPKVAAAEAAVVLVELVVVAVALVGTAVYMEAVVDKLMGLAGVALLGLFGPELAVNFHQLAWGRHELIY
jgi:hypothetical protein